MPYGRDYGEKTICTCGGALTIIGTIGVREFYRCTYCGSYAASAESVEEISKDYDGGPRFEYTPAESMCPCCHDVHCCYGPRPPDVFRPGVTGVIPRPPSNESPQ